MKIESEHTVDSLPKNRYLCKDNHIMHSIKKEKETPVNEEEIVLTPMMKQFLDLKAKHPDAVMLFRCGDFMKHILRMPSLQPKF